MVTSSNVPPVIKNDVLKQFIGFPCTITRLLLEIFITATAGVAAFSLPILFMSNPPPNYEQSVFLPTFSRALEEPHISSILLLVAVSFAAGVFERGPIWLVGPATMFGFPIWAIIDAMAGGGGHNLIPFEIIAYGFFAPFFIGPTLIGRLTNYLIGLWLSRHAS